MGNLASALTQLKKEHELAQQHVIQLTQAIAVIERLESRNTTASNQMSVTLPPAKKVMSAETRRKLSLAQKARWASTKPAQPVAVSRPAGPIKRTMSAAARKKISLALRARWAKAKKAA
jgi:type II secretory pathway component PulC